MTDQKTVPSLSKTRITSQIRLAVGISMLGIVAVAVIAFSTIGAVKIKSPAYNRILAANVLLADVLPPPAYIIESRLVVLELSRTSDRSERAELNKKLTQLEADFKTRSSYWKDNSISDEFAGELAVAEREGLRFFATVNDSFRPALAAGNEDAVRRLIDGPLAESYGKHRAAIDDIVVTATEENAKAEATAASTVSSRTRSLGIMIGSALALSLLLSWFLIRNLTRQLQGASSSLSDATDRLKISTDAIRDEATRTARQSADVAATGDSVTDGISTIASACEELTASITEISRAASEAVAVANEAVNEADAAVAMVARLDASSMEITNVVELISTIAEQTNLLALNATIEAARAGEMGRGFAVVANEVKELANKTSIATGEISEKIRNVQTESATAIDSIRRVADIVSQINGIQTTVAGAVEEQVATTNEIARSLNEAASGTSIVTEAIGVVASSAEGVEQNVGNAEEVSLFLGDVASDLRQLVGTGR